MLKVHFWFQLVETLILQLVEWFNSARARAECILKIQTLLSIHYIEQRQLIICQMLR